MGCWESNSGQTWAWARKVNAHQSLVQRNNRSCWQWVHTGRPVSRHRLHSHVGALGPTEAPDHPKYGLKAGTSMVVREIGSPAREKGRALWAQWVHDSILAYPPHLFGQHPCAFIRASQAPSCTLLLQMGNWVSTLLSFMSSAAVLAGNPKIADTQVILRLQGEHGTTDIPVPCTAFGEPWVGTHVLPTSHRAYREGEAESQSEGGDDLLRFFCGSIHGETGGREEPRGGPQECEEEEEVTGSETAPRPSPAWFQ